MIQTLRAVVCDIDGTLVKKGVKEMPARTRNALIRIHEEGILFGIASGRPVDEKMRKRKEEWKLPFDFDIMIGMNGGQLWDRFHPEVQQFYRLSVETMHEILNLMRPLHLIPSIYEGDHMVATALDPLQVESIERNQMRFIDTHGDEERLCVAPVNKILFRYDCDEAMLREYVDSHPSKKYQAVITYPGLIEFQDPRVNKGVALEKCAEQNNIPLEMFMAFGDLDNDNEMLEKAGWGVCLSNGGEATKKCADDITDYPVEEAGVGRYLEDHWFHRFEYNGK